MAYLVLARKYRPTLFADLVGQEHIVRTLDNAIALDRVHHAFLFTGARGVGKTTTARVFARALNCVKGPTTTPCGACGPCRDILAGSAPDVLEIDGASHTGVDNVRDLLESVRYLPASGRYKIYVIDEVHMLSTAAFNALLKTLEEPPPHVKFVFATTEPHKIPITILSRCQRFDFRRVSVAKLVTHLRHILEQEKVVLGPSALTAVARQAEGSVRDALSLLDQVLSYGGAAPDDEQVLEALGVVDRQTVFALCDALLVRDAAAMLRVISDVDARGHDLSELAAHLAEHLRDAAVVKCVQEQGPEFLDRSSGEIESIKAQAAQRSQIDLQQLFRHVLQVAQDVARSSMPRISLEMGLLRLFEMTPTADLSALVTRLDSLLGHGPSFGQGVATPGQGGVQGALKQGAPVSTPRGGSAGAPMPTADAPQVPGSTGAARPAATSGLAKNQGGANAKPMAPQTLPEAGQAPGPAAVSKPAASGQAPKGTAAEAARPVGSAVSAAPATAQDGMAAGHHQGWGRFVDKVRTSRPALASVLEHGHLLVFEPGKVEIGYEPGTFYWDAARDPDNAATATEFLTEHMGTAARFTVVAAHGDAAGVPSLAEVSAQRRETFDRGIQQTAREHVAVRQAVSILQGELTEVRQLAQASAAPLQE